MFKTVEGRVQYADYVLPFCLLRCPGWYRLLQCKIKTKRFVYVLDLEPRTSRRGRFLNVSSNWCYPCLWERLHIFVPKAAFFFAISRPFTKSALYVSHDTKRVCYSSIFWFTVICYLLVTSSVLSRSDTVFIGSFFFARHMVTIEFRSLYNWYL